jgi:hypothetical protein
LNESSFVSRLTVFVFGNLVRYEGELTALCRMGTGAIQGGSMIFAEFFTRHSSIAIMPFLFLLLLGVGVVDVKAVTVFGVNTSNQLVRFDSATPGTVNATLPITGLQAGEAILGIDFRPANGGLYGLGSTSRLYVINQATGVATQVGTASAFTLNGTDFGFDFNPVVDRIRVVSNTGQNLRLNPDTGGLAATDTPLNPGTPNVNAAAYTNNFAGTTTTTLFVIDTTLDSLFRQDPPNAGTLNLVGPLGVDASNLNGFDIAPSTGVAYAALTVAGTSRLYTINLLTGTATQAGAIGGGNTLRGLAVGFGSPASNTTSLDYDGDGRADYALFRLSNNTNFIHRSSNNSFYAFPFGLPTDVQTPGDYDGDGRADSAVWRPSTGVFFVLRSSDGAVQAYRFGIEGDEPVARDYDGDRRTDFAVVRRTGNQLVWYIAQSATNSIRIETFGLSSDVTAPGDYDGDGRFDLATFRDQAGEGVFYILRSTLGFIGVRWGIPSDLVVPGDYDGDGKTDVAVVRQGTSYTWYILRSSDGAVYAPQFGSKPDYTVQADYDGDGSTDVAVYRPENASFYILRSSNRATTQFVFGQNGDYPIANYDTH